VELATGSSSRPELAAALHRLRSTLARAKAELELADGEPAPPDRLLSDLREALELLGQVEAIALSIVPVLVLDDDERLGELMARGLRRLGYDAESTTKMRALRRGEIVVLDLGMTADLGAANREALRTARPIVVTGSADPQSRAIADDLGATDYLVKPVEIDDLVAAISRRVALNR
jgi:CheY-like chemotaxis protein